MAMNQDQIYYGYHGDWHNGLFNRTYGLHKGKYGDGFISEHPATKKDLEKYNEHDCKLSPDSSCEGCEAILKASVTQDLPRRREIISQADYPAGVNFI